MGSCRSRSRSRSSGSRRSRRSRSHRHSKPALLRRLRCLCLRPQPQTQPPVQLWQPPPRLLQIPPQSERRQLLRLLQQHPAVPPLVHLLHLSNNVRVHGCSVVTPLIPHALILSPDPPFKCSLAHALTRPDLPTVSFSAPPEAQGVLPVLVSCGSPSLLFAALDRAVASAALSADALLSALTDFIADESCFKAALRPLYVKAGCAAAPAMGVGTVEDDSLIRTFLRVPTLQPRVVELLLQKVRGAAVVRCVESD